MPSPLDQSFFKEPWSLLVGKLFKPKIWRLGVSFTDSVQTVYIHTSFQAHAISCFLLLFFIPYLCLPICEKSDFHTRQQSYSFWCALRYRKKLFRKHDRLDSSPRSKPTWWVQSLHSPPFQNTPQERHTQPCTDARSSPPPKDMNMAISRPQWPGLYNTSGLVVSKVLSLGRQNTGWEFFKGSQRWKPR